MGLRQVISVALGLAMGTAAYANDPIVGVWQTEPDRKDLISHVEIAHCGSAVCGRSLVAFDASGARVVTGNEGRQLFWGMKAQGNGAYSGGTVSLPLVNVEAPATMLLNGRLLHVRACKLGICAAQTWTKLR